MNTQIVETATDDLEKSFEITVSSATLNDILETRFNEIRTTTQIDGFRPGMATTSHIRQRFGVDEMRKSIQTVIEQTIQDVLRDHGHDTFSQVRVTTKEGVSPKAVLNGADLMFRIEYELLPKIDIEAIKNLELKAFSVDQVSKHEFAKKVLQFFARGSSANDETTVDAVAELGDCVIVECDVDRSPGPPNIPILVKIVLGEEFELAPSKLNQRLLGARVGDSHTVQMDLSEKHLLRQLSGIRGLRSAKVKYIIKSVRGNVAVDDAFAKAMGVENLDQLHNKFTANLSMLCTQIGNKVLTLDIRHHLNNLYDFEPPERLVNYYINTAWKAYKSRKVENANNGEPHSQTDWGTFRAELFEDIKKKLRIDMIFAAIGKQVGLDVTNAELQESLDATLQSFPKKDRSSAADYYNRGYNIDKRYADLFNAKVINYILENVALVPEPIPFSELLWFYSINSLDDTRNRHERID